MERIADTLSAKERIADMRAAFKERIAHGLIGDENVRAGLRKRDNGPFVIPDGGRFRVKNARTAKETRGREPARPQKRKLSE